MDRLVPVVDSVTVMNSAPGLCARSNAGAAISGMGGETAPCSGIALESGPIPDEVPTHYRPARSSDVALVASVQNKCCWNLSDAVFPRVLVDDTTFRLSLQHRSPAVQQHSRDSTMRCSNCCLNWRSVSAWPSFAGRPCMNLSRDRGNLSYVENPAVTIAFCQSRSK